MNVRELIDQLTTYDPDLLVTDSEGAELEEVEYGSGDLVVSLWFGDSDG